MATVSNRKLACMWANGATGSHRGNGNIRMDYALLYSYTTLVAVRLSADLALFTSRDYSATTAKQTGQARGAFTGMSLRVPNVTPTTVSDHDINIKHVEWCINDARDMANRARTDRYADVHNGNVKRLSAALDAYRAHFGL